MAPSSRPARAAAPPAGAPGAAAGTGCVMLDMPTSLLRRPSGELADRAFEQAPGLVAEALLPLGVEAGVAQRGAEAVVGRAIELHALGLEVGLQRLVELAD